MSTFFSRMQALIREKIEKHERGLYIVLVFPIAFSCLLTFAVARVITIYWPWLYVEWSAGLHVHHFAYGLIVLAVTGYLGLIFSGPRARFLISMLYGVGLGMAFDEFAMWIHLREDDVARWQYDGIIIVVTIFFLLATLQPGVKFFLHHWPFSRKKLILEHIERKPYAWDDGKPV